MTSTRQVFNHELEELRQDILEMGARVGQAVEQAMESLEKKDLKLAKQIMAADDDVDQMEIDIEDKCMVLIARQQPLAKDLRIIGTGLKITTDLERVGDHAYDIAKIATEIGDKPLIKPLIDLPRMSVLALKMLNDSLSAYTNLDISLAEQVCIDDDAVDDIYHQTVRDLLTYMMEDPTTISQATQLLFVARYLERMADHATNIAEWVIYLVTGQRLRKQ